MIKNGKGRQRTIIHIDCQAKKAEFDEKIWKSEE